MARDAELDHLREAVSCATVLERSGWTLDRPESTAGAQKYRRGEGEIVIVTHGGRGWWQPLAGGQGLGEERGDILALDQWLHGGSLGHVRKRLRFLAGVAPQREDSDIIRVARPRDEDRPAPTGEPSLRWRATEPPKAGSAGWRYLTEERGIPAPIVAQAVSANVLREGIYGTIWGAHRDATGTVTGWEMRGPRFKGFSKGGDKGLFVLGEFSPADQLVVAEAMIDSMSASHLLNGRMGSGSVRHVSTGGGFGPGTEAALKSLIKPGLEVVAATDCGTGGNVLADRLARLAQDLGAKFRRLQPATAPDWNDELRLSKAKAAQARPQDRTPTLSLRAE